MSARKLTQTKVGIDCNVSRETIRKILTYPDYKPSLRTIDKIAKGLKVSARTLLPGKTKKTDS
jgi:transcriptional regulator with XRE-family HTH domain